MDMGAIWEEVMAGDKTLPWKQAEAEKVSHPDHSLLCMFLCFVWSGCDLSGRSMLDVLFVCFCVWA